MPCVAPARIVLLVAALLCAAFTAGYAAPLHALGGGHPVTDGTSAPCPHHSDESSPEPDLPPVPAEMAPQAHDALACAGACCGICFNVAMITDRNDAGSAAPAHAGRIRGAAPPLAPDGDDPPPRLTA